MTPPNRYTLATLPEDVLVMILLRLHTIDIFPLKLAGNRRITDLIHRYYPLSPSLDAYITAISSESLRRGEGYAWPNDSGCALRFTVARGQANLLELELKKYRQRSRRAFWTIRFLWRLLKVPPSKELKLESMQWPFDEGLYALHFAATFNSTALVRSLARTPGTWIDCRTSDAGKTPLHLAAKEGHVEMVLLLLEMGASIWARDDDRRTALTFAAGAGQKRVVEALLQHQRTTWTRIFHRARIGQAIDSAREWGHLDLAALLESELQSRRGWMNVSWLRNL